MTASNPSLSANKLAIGYAADQPLVSGASLELVPGDLVVLLGPNGSGKSTCLRTLAGLMPPLSGNVLLDGKELATWSDRERARRLAVVFTAIPAVSDLLVHDFLLLGRYPHRDAWGRDPEAALALEAATEALSLEPLLHRSLYRLSDGERQRVLLARALVQASPVVLLDEPTHYLDPAQSGRIQMVMETLSQQRERTLIVATHDVDWALRAASRIGLLHEKRLEWHVPASLAAEPQRLAAAFNAPGMRFDTALGRFVAR